VAGGWWDMTRRRQTMSSPLTLCGRLSEFLRCRPPSGWLRGSCIRAARQQSTVSVVVVGWAGVRRDSSQSAPTVRFVCEGHNPKRSATKFGHVQTRERECVCVCERERERCKLGSAARGIQEPNVSLLYQSITLPQLQPQPTSLGWHCTSVSSVWPRNRSGRVGQFIGQEISTGIPLHIAHTARSCLCSPCATDCLVLACASGGQHVV
jgi:hypothetical protein